jgi:hypothetical protein
VNARTLILTFEDGTMMIVDMPDGVVATQTERRVTYTVAGTSLVTISGPANNTVVDGSRLVEVEVGES